MHMRPSTSQPTNPQRRAKLKQDLGLPDDYGVADSSDDEGAGHSSRVACLSVRAAAVLALGSLWSLQRDQHAVHEHGYCPR